MRVFGISPLDKDSTVTIVEDGRIVFAAGEERFSRVKLQDGFPWHALQAAVQYARHWRPLRSIASRIHSSPRRRRPASSAETWMPSGSSSTMVGSGAT